MTNHTPTPSTSVPSTEEVADRHRRWVFGWEREAGDEEFRLHNRFADFYDWTSKDVILYDDFDPQDRVARSADAYGQIWEATFNSLRSARHVIVDGPAVVTSGDLAASRLVFVARIEPLEGDVVGIRTTTSLVWRRGADGWRIVREHNSTVHIALDDAERQLDG